MVDTHINIWLKFCNVWAAATCPGPSRFGFMQGESKTSWFRKINKTWRVCPHFHSARLANTTWPHKSSRWWYSDTDIPAQPSPLGECSNASCNLACSRKNFIYGQPVRLSPAEISGLSPHDMEGDYARWVPAKCAASCLIFWKKNASQKWYLGLSRGTLQCSFHYLHFTS